MHGIFNQNDEIKSIYKLSNIVSTIDNITEICIPKDFIYSMYFQFQGKKYRFRDIADSLIDGGDSEIFPGIYMRSANSRNVLMQLINNVLQKKQFILRNENRRDSFQICSEVEKNEPTSDYHDGDIISTMIENVNPLNVEQPGCLGGGKCGGCAVYSYFNMLGVLGESDIDGYYFWGDEEAIESTKNEEFFLEKCKHTECFHTYEKILKEGYSENLEMRDQIKVTYRNGKYYAGEGKHRICVMRRFDYNNEIPMRVTRIGESSGELMELDKQYFSDNKHILESCYSSYARMGISADDVRELLKNPNATILDYLRK